MEPCVLRVVEVAVSSGEQTRDRVVRDDRGHPRPVVKLALAGENRPPLRGAEQQSRSRRSVAASAIRRLCAAAHKRFYVLRLVMRCVAFGVFVFPARRDLGR